MKVGDKCNIGHDYRDKVGFIKSIQKKECYEVVVEIQEPRGFGQVAKIDTKFIAMYNEHKQLKFYGGEDGIGNIIRCELAEK